MSAAEVYGAGPFQVLCHEHSLNRTVETGAHAANLQALHNRRDHGDDTDNSVVQLTAAAVLITTLDRELRQHRGDPARTGSTRAKKAQGRLNGALLVWEALTGLTNHDALAYAQQIAAADPPITAAVPPF